MQIYTGLDEVTVTLVSLSKHESQRQRASASATLVGNELVEHLELSMPLFYSTLFSVESIFNLLDIPQSAPSSSVVLLPDITSTILRILAPHMSKLSSLSIYISHSDSASNEHSSTRGFTSHNVMKASNSSKQNLGNGPYGLREVPVELPLSGWGPFQQSQLVSTIVNDPDEVRPLYGDVFEENDQLEVGNNNIVLNIQSYATGEDSIHIQGRISPFARRTAATAVALAMARAIRYKLVSSGCDALVRNSKHGLLGFL
ncbi:hypothetical protein Tco_1553968 [Tanacetum coccineum]